MTADEMSAALLRGERVSVEIPVPWEPPFPTPPEELAALLARTRPQSAAIMRHLAQTMREQADDLDRLAEQVDAQAQMAFDIA